MTIEFGPCSRSIGASSQPNPGSIGFHLCPFAHPNSEHALGASRVFALLHIFAASCNPLDIHNPSPNSARLLLLTTHGLRNHWSGLEITAGQALSYAWNIKSDTHQQLRQHAWITRNIPALSPLAHLSPSSLTPLTLLFASNHFLDVSGLQQGLPLFGQHGFSRPRSLRFVRHIINRLFLPTHSRPCPYLQRWLRDASSHHVHIK